MRDIHGNKNVCIINISGLIVFRVSSMKAGISWITFFECESTNLDMFSVIDPKPETIRRPGGITPGSCSLCTLKIW